jgi:hypothetical protein
MSSAETPFSTLVHRATAKGAMRLGKGGGGGSGDDGSGGAAVSSEETKAPPRTIRLAKGTSLFHGTRYEKGGPKWWEGDDSPYPNRAGEDGGVSFTRDVDASPKTKNANVLLEYTLAWDLDAIHCASKGEFYKIFQNDSSAVCFTDHEQEVSFPPGAIEDWMEGKPKVLKEP